MQPAPDVFRFDAFRLVVPMRALFHGATAIPLRAQEFDALAALVGAAGTLVGKDDLAHAIRSAACSDATLAQVVYRVRRTLAQHAPGTTFIATVAGHGYQFVRPVTSLASTFASPALPAHEPVDASCESADGLLRDGHAYAALQRLAAARDRVGTPHHATRVLLLEARALHALDRVAEGDAALRDAQSAAVQAGEPDDLRAAVLLARGQVSYARQEHAAALRYVYDALALQPVTDDARLACARVRSLLFGAIVEQEHGMPQRSIALSDAARVLLEGVDDAPRTDVAEALVQAAYARIAVPGALRDAQHNAERALAIAQRHGLAGAEAWATIALAVVAETAGDLPGAVSYARAAVVVAARSLGGDQLARIHLIAGRVEASAGNGAGAYAAVTRAKPLTSLPVFRGIVAMRESEALLALHENARAAERAAESIATLSAVTGSHYIGTAYLAKARAEHGSAARGARESIEHAVEYLRRGGSVRDLSLALDLRYRLTRDRRSAREARDLRQGAQI